MSVFGIDNLQVQVSKCPVHTETYSSVLNTVCMGIKPVFSYMVISKMASSIKLNSLITLDTTRV